MTAPRPDGELLTAFTGQADQAAFAELVERHGPMVVRVAEAILRDRHGAEDVAQAAFLVLAQKAAGLRKSETIAPWLHRVSWRLAIDELRRRQSRQRREEDNVRMNTPASAADLSAVHEELGGLPDRYRSALVLCYLDGEPQESAARRLGLSAEALRKRLERARELLRKKLVRRGVVVGSAGALTALLTAESSAAPLPATFVAATVKAATGGAVPATVATMIKETICVMAITKLHSGIWASVVVALLIGGGWLAVRWTAPTEPVSGSPIRPRTVPAPQPITAPGTSASPAVPPTGDRSLILRMTNPPLSFTDSRGLRYVAKNVTNLTGAVWRHYSSGMDPYFCGMFRVTAAEQIQMQQMLDTAWQNGDALATCFEVSPTNDALLVRWKGEAFREVYRAQRQASRDQVLNGTRGILGAERAEVLGWLPQAGNIYWPDVLPNPARLTSEYLLTVSVTNANGVIAMRYHVIFGNGEIMQGQNHGLGPWPALGEQLGIPRQTVLANLAAQRQLAAQKGFFKYRDPIEPLDDAPIAAEDTATGQRYLYAPDSAR